MALKFLVTGEGGAIADVSDNPAPISVDGTAYATEDYSKFGTWSTVGGNTNRARFVTTYTDGAAAANKVAACVTTGAMTLQCWVYFETVALRAGKVLGIEQNGTYYMDIRQTTAFASGARNFTAVCVGPSGSSAHGSINLAVDTWHHLSLVVSAGASSFYANGARVSVDVANVGSWPVGIESYEVPFLRSEVMTMYMDEAALHDTALFSGASYTLPGSYAPAPPTVSGYVAAPGPLAAARVLANLPYGARAAAPAIYGAARALARHDFTGLLGDALSVYAMDLITPGGAVRVPVSSWQATLQTTDANYVQCVVPACGPWLDALGVATAFVIYRRAVLPGGQAFEYEMARAPAEQQTLDRGPERYTCTLSGYSPGFAEDLAPPAAYDRALVGVRSVSTGAGGTRVRCAVDWLLRPGHRAFVDGVPLVVAYINYYAPTGFDAYMDVGSRA